MRYGFIHLRSAIMEASYWSMVVSAVCLPQCFPDTISFNNGLPMEPQARDPQVRFVYKYKIF